MILVGGEAAKCQNVRRVVTRIRPLDPISGIRSTRTHRLRRFSPHIPVMKTTNARQSGDLGTGRRSMLDRSSEGRVAKTGMDPFSVVVVDVLAEKSP